jgi:hypothetical protein
MSPDPSWIDRFWEYTTTVLGYWQFWVAVAFMLERSLERFLPSLSKKIDPYFTPSRRRRLFIWIAIIAFVYANFRAYDDVNARFRITQNALNKIITDSAAKKDRTSLRIKLRNFYTDGNQFAYGTLPKDISSDDFKIFSDQYTSWAFGTAAWIKENMGEDAESRFTDISSGAPTPHWNRAVNQEHNDIINKTIRLRQNLETLIQSDAWDKP